MIPKTHMTIQDYFSRAGVGSAARSSQALDNASRRVGHRNFADLLKGLQHPGEADSFKAKGGLRITDYLENPICAKKVPDRSNATPLGGAASPRDKIKPTETAALGLPERRSSALEVKAMSSSQAKTEWIKENGPDDQIDNGIKKASAKYNLPAELIRSVIRAESNFQPDAVSSAGAQGLMQLMPATAKELGVNDAFDVEQNIDGGARYLRQMLDMFDGDLKQALSAYNAGPGTVIKYKGNVPYHETRTYVRKVMAFSKQYGGVKAAV